MKSKKKIIIFGATGTIGAYATIYLNNNGYEVIAVGHRKSDNGFFSKYGIVYLSLNIENAIEFSILPQKDVFAVVHLAGNIPARMKGYVPNKYIDSIVSGTFNVLEYTRKVCAEKIVFTQSISDVAYLCGSVIPILPDSISKFPLNNDHSIYSICKNAAVNMIEHYYYRYNIKRFVLRLPNIYLYHPNDHYFVDGIEKWQSYRLLITKAMKGDPIEVWGDPNLVRDIVYVKDCIQVILCSLNSNVDGGVYNVGTGIGTSLIKQIEGIIDVFSPKEKRSPIIMCPEKPNALQYIFDISKTKIELDYKPQYDYMSYLYDMKSEMEKKTFNLLWGEN